MISTSERQALAEAIKTLYEVFSEYQLSRKIEGCPCCISAEDEFELHRKPLHELTAKNLSRYAFKAMSTWGDENDFRHFLPRLLELVTDADSITFEVDIEIILGKLHYAKWQTWPHQEQEAVRQYLSALWKFLLTLPPEEITIGEYLCGIGQAEDDLTHYLEIWHNMGTANALNQMVALEASETGLRKRNLTNSFWSGRREQMLQVVDWLYQARIEMLR